MNRGKLKFNTAIALLISGMIGSAIFSLSGLTILYAGTASIISWIVAGIIQLMYGLFMAELATTYKRNGGIFVFPENTFKGNKGTTLGFLSTWGNVLTDVISISFSSMSISLYLSSTFIGLLPYKIHIAIISILFCLIINYINFSLAGKINYVLTIILVAILFIFSYFVFTKGNFSIENYNDFFNNGSVKPFGFLKAIPIAMLGYSSIISVSFMAEEIENQKKNIPLCVSIGAGIVIIIYTIVLLATNGSVTSFELETNNMTYIPLFYVCQSRLVNNVFLLKFVVIAAVIALLTTMLVVLAMSGRVLKAVADKKLLPEIFSKNGKFGTPIFAMAIEAILSIILVFHENIINILINMGALFSIITLTINLISLLFTRLNKNLKEEHYIAPFNNMVIVILLIIMCVCYMPDIFNGGYMIWLFSIIWYILGALVLYIFRRKKIK